MTSAVQIFLILVVVGMFLIGAEIFLPGGVIGVIGALALLMAAGMGFVAFGVQGGMLCALVIVILTGICIVLWVRFFPSTRMGKNLMLSKDGKLFKSATAELMNLAGKEGVALSTLRPSGIAQIDGKRVDVVADGSWIEAGKRVCVTSGRARAFSFAKPPHPRAARPHEICPADIPRSCTALLFRFQLSNSSASTAMLLMPALPQPTN